MWFRIPIQFWIPCQGVKGDSHSRMLWSLSIVKTRIISSSVVAPRIDVTFCVTRRENRVVLDTVKRRYLYIQIFKKLVFTGKAFLTLLLCPTRSGKRTVDRCIKAPPPTRSLWLLTKLMLRSSRFQISGNALLSTMESDHNRTVQ